jgi:uncharacterized membrane protein (DUF2068 family)
VFSIIRLMEMSAAPVPSGPVFKAVAILMFGNTAAMLVSAWLVGKQDVWGYVFALAILAVNIFFTFTDQVGFFDWATLAVDLVIVAILVVKRRVFLPVSSTG